MGVVVDGAFERGERAADVGWGGRLVGGEQGAQEPVFELAVEDGDADALAGEDVAPDCQRFPSTKVRNSPSTSVMRRPVTCSARSSQCVPRSLVT